MSTAEQLRAETSGVTDDPSTWPEGWPRPPHNWSPLPYRTEEMQAARLEDPTFAESLGRARAAALGETYDPAKHYPHRAHGRSLTRITPEDEERLQAAIDRFEGRGERVNRYLRAVR